MNTEPLEIDMAPHLAELAIERPEFNEICIDAAIVAYRVPLDIGRHESPWLFNPGLGAMSVLPPEIVSQILMDLDLETLVSLRRVNRHIRFIIDWIPQWKHLALHCPMLIRAALTLGVASHTSCRELHQLLTAFKCAYCAEDGIFVSLLAFRRVCFRCLSSNPDLVPISLGRATENFQLGARGQRAVAKCLTIPGNYSFGSISVDKRLRFVDLASARAEGIKTHGSLELMLEARAHTRLRRTHRREVMLALNLNSRPQPYQQMPHDSRILNPNRYVAAVRVPFVDLATDGISWGFSCKACCVRPIDWRTNVASPYWTVYSPPSMFEHFMHCRGAQRAYLRLMEDGRNTPWGIQEKERMDDLISRIRALLAAGEEQ